MRRILITNDDGIGADGLLRLVQAACAFGEVWVVAPDSQRSAASHSITLHGAVSIREQDYPVSGVRAFACTGTPADCVRVGSLYVMPEPPELLLSGINRGYNTATDLQYSGTAGAAFEGAFQGIRSGAFSEQDTDCHEVTAAYLPGLIAELLTTEPGYGEILNVNFPGCPMAECRGILRGRTVSRGMIFRDRYKGVETLPDGSTRLMVDSCCGRGGEPGSDLRAVQDGFVSVGFVRNISG